MSHLSWVHLLPFVQTLTNCYGIQRKLPSPGFQVEIVLVDYSGSQPPKQKPADGSADKKSDAKESNAAPVESNKETGSDDKDDVFSDNEAEDGSSKGRKVSSGGQGGVNGAKASETSVAQHESSAAASGITKITISGEQGIARARDDISLKTEASSKSSSTKAPPAAVESSSMSEFKAIAADASVFSFGDEDDYGSE